VLSRFVGRYACFHFAVRLGWCTRAWAGRSGAIRARSKQEAGCEEACKPGEASGPAGESGRDGNAAVRLRDLLDSREATLGPGATVNLSAPMADDAQAMGVAAFFRDQANAEWQRVIPKSQWKKTDPLRLVVIDNQMELE